MELKELIDIFSKKSLSNDILVKVYGILLKGQPTADELLEDRSGLDGVFTDIIALIREFSENMKLLKSEFIKVKLHTEQALNLWNLNLSMSQAKDLDYYAKISKIEFEDIHDIFTGIKAIPVSNIKLSVLYQSLVRIFAKDIIINRVMVKKGIIYQTIAAFHADFIYDKYVMQLIREIYNQHGSEKGETELLFDNFSKKETVERLSYKGMLSLNRLCTAVLNIMGRQSEKIRELEANASKKIEMLKSKLGMAEEKSEEKKEIMLFFPKLEFSKDSDRKYSDYMNYILGAKGMAENQIYLETQKRLIDIKKILSAKVNLSRKFGKSVLEIGKFLGKDREMITTNQEEKQWLSDILHMINGTNNLFNRHIGYPVLSLKDKISAKSLFSFYQNKVDKNFESNIEKLSLLQQLAFISFMIMNSETLKQLEKGIRPMVKEVDVSYLTIFILSQMLVKLNDTDLRMTVKNKHVVGAA